MRTRPHREASHLEFCREIRDATPPSQPATAPAITHNGHDAIFTIRIHATRCRFLFESASANISACPAERFNVYFQPE